MKEFIEKNKKPIAVGIAALVMILAAFGLYRAGVFGPSKVTVETVQTREMPLRINSEANVSALNKATITPSISGPVLDMKVKVGDEVQAGQQLALLDGGALQSQLASLNEQLAQVRASNIAQAQAAAVSAPGGGAIQPGAISAADVTRAQEMLSAGIITQKEFSTIQQRAAASSGGSGGGIVSTGGASYAETAGIETAIAQVQAQLAQTQVVAPISGRVSAIYNEDRKVAVAGRPFMMIQQLSPVVAALSIPQDFALKLAQVTDKASIQVSLELQNGNTIPGELTYIDTASPQGTPSVLVKATFDNKDGAISPGDFYTLHIESPLTAMVTAVPESSVHTNSDGKFVYVLTKENTVDVRLVEVGETVDGYMAITNGLADGEKIITNSGKYELGQQVTTGEKQ